MVADTELKRKVMEKVAYVSNSMPNCKPLDNILAFPESL